MADTKILSLTATTTLLTTDILPVVTDPAGTPANKKITFGNLWAAIVTAFKGIGSEVDTGTDDNKFLTSKALKDSNNVPSVAPSTSGNVMTSNGSKWVSTTPAPGTFLTAVPSADHTASGLTLALTAGVTMNFGDVGYIKSDGKVGLIDADAIATMTGLVMCVDASISADASGNFMLMGVARDDTWAWTVGGIIYGTVTGTTGNTLSQTAPTGTDDVVQIMGVATHADRMIFNPQLVQVERV
ncbi:MAG: hypothetical protein WA019_04010 [Candidatus Moraniibacteriota bacterium]